VPRILFVLSLVVGTALAPTLSGQSRYWEPTFAQTQVQHGLVYGEASSRHSGLATRLLLDLYEPTGDGAPARPAVVLAHGGGFLSGSRADPNLVDLAQRLAAVGYVAVSVDYRLVPASQSVVYDDVRDAAHDLKAAVRWLRAQALPLRIDPERIACIGASAGAIAALEGFYRVGEGSSGNAGWSSSVGAVVDLWGAAVQAASIDANEAPLLILHGVNDPVVPFSFAQELADRANAVGLPHAFYPLAGQGHAPWAVLRQSWIDNILGFLYRELDLVEVAGLAVEPGWASPGFVRLWLTVPRGDQWILYNSWAPGNLPVPGLGWVQLDLATAWFIDTRGYAGPAEVGRQATFEWIPAGLSGTAHWQAVTVRGGELHQLTNAVVTPF